MTDAAPGLPWAVHDLLVKYLEAGPENVTVPGNQDNWYQIPSGLQFTEHVGIETVESISMYVPPPETKEENQNPPVLRRLKRDIRPAAMARFKERRRLEWPLVEADYFVMSLEQLDTLDSLVRRLELAAEDAPVASDGASAWFWYGPERRSLKVPPPNQPPSRWYTLDLISLPIQKVHFYASDPSLAALKAAWEGAWQHLQACCATEQRTDVEESWKIEPHLYARLLSAGSTT